MNEETPLHILFLSSWYPNRNAATLGIFVRRHAQAVALKNKVTVLHAVPDAELKDGEFRLDRKTEGNLSEFIVYYGRSNSGFKLFRAWHNWKLLRKHYLFGLEKLIERNGKPDLIHAHVPWPIGKIARLISKKLRIPFGLTEHWTGYQPEDGRYKGGLVIRVTRLSIRKSAFIAPVSHQLQQAMEAHGLKGNYHVIPNVVDTDVFKPNPKAHSKTRFLHVSTLDDAQKDVTGILKAFQQALREMPEMELVIVGGGNDENTIKRISNEMGLTFRGVEFKGKLQGEALVDELNQADVLLLNSRYENQPVVILEALACGIPVIAPAIGGIPEVVNAAQGIVFNRSEEGALKKALLAFHASKDGYSQDELRRYAVATFSMKAISEQLDELYRKTLKEC